MAGNPECMSGDGRGAIFLGTFLSDGTSVTLCEDHFVDFLAGTLETLTGAPIAELLSVQPPAVVDADEAKFDAFLTEHADEIDTRVKGGATLEEAIIETLTKYGEIPDESTTINEADDEPGQHLVTDDDVAAIIEAVDLDESDSTLTN